MERKFLFIMMRFLNKTTKHEKRGRQVLSNLALPFLCAIIVLGGGMKVMADSSHDLYYFYQEGCSKCNRVNVLLNHMVKKYPQLNIKEVDLNTLDGQLLNETLSNRLNLSMEKRLIAPSIFIGNDYISPDEITESRVEALIQKYLRGSEKR